MEGLTSSAAGPASSFGRTGVGSSSTLRGQRSRSPERGWLYRVHCKIFGAFTGPNVEHHEVGAYGPNNWRHANISSRSRGR